MTTTKIIPTSQLSQLEAYIKRANKTALKLHLPLITFEQKNIRTITRTIPSITNIEESLHIPKTETMEICDVEINGEIPHIEGYDIAATTDSTEAGNLLYNAPGISLPEVYRTRIECDHCNTKRNRKYTVILRNQETQEFIQVGHSCLKDFFPYLSDIEQLVNYATSLISYFSASDDEDKLWSSGGGEYAQDLETFLRATIVCIREYGWTSASEAYDDQSKTATKYHVSNLIDTVYRHLTNDQKRMHADMNSTDVIGKAKYYMAFYEDNLLGKEGKSDYEHNLSVLFQIGYITSKNYGFAASMVPYITREMSKREERERLAKLPPSQYQGKIGVRQVFQNLTIIKTVEVGTQYGVSTLYLFRDPEGNVFKWFASNPISISDDNGVRCAKFGDVVNLKATVKSHDEYQGVCQTSISRATVV